MGEKDSFQVTLPRDVAQMVRDKVASGAYESESDVIRDGLRILQARDAVVERWLRDEVVPTFDRVMSGEEKLIPAEDVFSGLEQRYRARKSQQRV
jgi:antitoxin ParD1/3/4